MFFNFYDSVLMREMYFTYLNNTFSGAHYCSNQKGFLALQLHICPSYSGNVFFPGPSLSWHVDKISVIGDI